MANKYYEQHKDRSPLADVGMTVAMAVTIVTLLKLLMYGLTYVTLAWLIIALLYILVTTASSPLSKTRRVATVFFLFVSLAGLYASFVYDKPVIPKTESNMKESVDEIRINEDNDEVSNSDVIVETPKPVAVETDNIVPEDASTFEEIGSDDTSENYSVSNVSEDEDVEVIDLHSDNDPSVNGYDHTDMESNDIISKEQPAEFDESFK